MEKPESPPWHSPACCLPSRAGTEMLMLCDGCSAHPCEPAGLSGLPRATFLSQPCTLGSGAAWGSQMGAAEDPGMGISSWHLIQPGASIPLQTAVEVSESLVHPLQTLPVAVLLPLSLLRAFSPSNGGRIWPGSCPVAAGCERPWSHRDKFPSLLPSSSAATQNVTLLCPFNTHPTLAGH